MIEKNREYVKSFFLLSLATVFSLTTHIFLMKYSQILIAFLLESDAPVTDYNFVTTSLAYLTALCPSFVLFFIYTRIRHLLPKKNNILKALVLTICLLGLKGELFRQPFMNFICSFELGAGKALLFTILQQLHIWLSNFVLCTSIVYFFQESHFRPFERSLKPAVSSLKV